MVVSCFLISGAHTDVVATAVRFRPGNLTTGPTVVNFSADSIVRVRGPVREVFLATVFCYLR